MIDLQPVTLEGKVVRLEPLSEAHVPGLAEVGPATSHPALSTYLRQGFDVHASCRAA